MKKLLVIGPQEVMPPTDGGREGIHAALKALTLEAEVTYLYPTIKSDKEISAKYLAIGVTAVPIVFEPRESYFLIFRSLLFLKPYKFKKYSTRESLQKFNSALKSLSFDAIICCHPHMFDVAEFIRDLNDWSCPIVLREHNIEYSLVEGYANSLSGLKKLAALVIAKITKKEEIKIWGKADGVAFLTSTDFKMAKSQYCAKSFFVAPEGTPISTRNLSRNKKTNKNLLILLNKKATQSVLNVAYFLETVWSDAISSLNFPETSITITGVTLDELADTCSLSTNKLTDLRVSCVGFVDSLDELFDSSLALISPTYVGGGIRKKILESMANHLPVIASPLDVHSTDYFQHGFNILEFDCVEDLRDAILYLSNSEQSDQISKSARSTVEIHASWNKFAVVINDYLSSIEYRKLKK